MQLYNLTPKYQMRRILMCESEQIVDIYKTLKKDAPFVGKVAVKAIMQNGAFYGIFLANKLVACGGYCKKGTPIPFIKRLTNALKTPNKSAVILPFAGNVKHCVKLLNYFCGHSNFENYVLAMPTTSESALFMACFKHEMKLVALCPLENLRIHYIFLSKGTVQSTAKQSIIILKQDSLILSRSLEQGYVGVELQDNYIRLEKQNEGSNTG